MRLIDNLLPTADRVSNLVTPSSFGFNGNTYPIFGWQGSSPEWPDSDFLGYIAGIHNRNGVVAAAVETRALLLSQIRFGWNIGGEFVENRASRRLNRPSGTVTRPSFLKSLEYDASYHGSAYVVNADEAIRRLRPDHCTVILGSDSDPDWDGSDAQVILPWDAEVIGLIYHPNSLTGGPVNTSGARAFGRSEFAIWSPEPDPVNLWRGTAWVTSVLREIVADGQATDHTTKFFENAATPNLVFIMDPSKAPDEIRKFAEVINGNHSGSGKAFKNLFLGGGTDVKTVGANLESLNLKDLTGGYENRVAIRSRVHPVILGTREGLSGSSLNAGNYASARRMLADGWYSPATESLCATLERLVPVPTPNAELAFDRSRVLFLQEDEKDAADIRQINSVALRQLVEAGYEPDSAKEYIATGDISKLKHTGNVSVQLQPPGSDLAQETDDEDS